MAVGYLAARVAVRGLNRVRRLSSSQRGAMFAKKAQSVKSHVSRNKFWYTLGGATAGNIAGGVALNRRYAKKHGASTGQRRLATAAGVLGVGGSVALRAGGLFGRKKSSKTRAVGSFVAGGPVGALGYSIRSRSRRMRRA